MVFGMLRVPVFRFGFVLPAAGFVCRRRCSVFGLVCAEKGACALIQGSFVAMERFEVVCAYLRVLPCDYVLYADFGIIDSVHVSYLYCSVLQFGGVRFEHRCVTQLTECEHFSDLWGLVEPCCVWCALDSVVVCKIIFEHGVVQGILPVRVW